MSRPSERPEVVAAVANAMRRGADARAVLRAAEAAIDEADRPKQQQELPFWLVYSRGPWRIWDINHSGGNYTCAACNIRLVKGDKPLVAKSTTSDSWNRVHQGCAQPFLRQMNVDMSDQR